MERGECAPQCEAQRGEEHGSAGGRPQRAKPCERCLRRSAGEYQPQHPDGRHASHEGGDEPQRKAHPERILRYRRFYDCRSNISPCFLP